MNDFYSIGLALLGITIILIVREAFIRRSTKKEKPSFYTIEKGQEKYNLILEEIYNYSCFVKKEKIFNNNI